MSDAILHTLNQGPGDADLFQRCADALGEQDTLLLIENGVYWALPAYQARLSALNCGQVLCLQADLEARGITTQTCLPASDVDFVRLVIDHRTTLSWF